jgi:hypothetical protein
MAQWVAGGAGYVLRDDSRVSPHPVSPELVRLVARIQHVAWPLWAEPSVRTRRDVAELCRLLAARGLTVLSWLAAGEGPELSAEEWLLANSRLTGTRQERMYAAAERVPEPVRALVAANWSWALATPHGGQVTASFLASGAYPQDGYSAAHATVALLRLWERQPWSRQLLAAAWAATRTAADWCRAAEARSAHGGDTPLFTYPRAPAPPRASLRPWVVRLLGLEDLDTTRAVV